jgi:hypothetical protein
MLKSMMSMAPPWLMLVVHLGRLERLAQALPEPEE